MSSSSPLLALDPLDDAATVSPDTLQIHNKEFVTINIDDEDGDREDKEISPPPPLTRRRMVNRDDGRSTVSHAGIGRWTFGFIKDGFTTLINTNWWVIILVFCAVYIISWLFFAVLWVGIAQGYGGANNTCVNHVDGFPSAFLFSIETEMTIGYGNKFVTNNCHVGSFFVVAQSIVGLVIDAILLGLVFAKLSLPRNRRKSLIFSDVAVIHKIGDELVFECRVGDIRRSQLVECHVRLQLYWFKPGSYGRRPAFEQHDLDVGYDTGQDRLFLLTPVSIVHPITPSSPFYGLTNDQLRAADFEVVVILEGIVEATGLTAQALWSYVPEEVEFDRMFVPAVGRARGGKWVVDFSKINTTVPDVAESEC